jgi:hypothetical protein
MSPAWNAMSNDDFDSRIFAHQRVVKESKGVTYAKEALSMDDGAHILINYFRRTSVVYF